MTLIDKNGDNKCEYHIPKLPDEYLEINFVDDDEEEITQVQQSCPFAITETSLARIIDAKILTHGDDVKETYSLELSNEFTSFKPGDTIGIITETREEDIKKLFNHLGVASVAEKKIKISKKLTSTKKHQGDSSYLEKVTTLNEIFKSCVDIYSLPRKLLIRILANYTNDKGEKKELEKLCSTEGSDWYTKLILETNMTFLDFILQYKTCCPPVITLLENLPKLLPRPYSIASSPLASTNKIRIVFSVIKKTGGSLKEGLCTGRLKNIAKCNYNIEEVKMYFRKGNGFNLPDTNVPLILIGPGTGIAPFIGFLEHRKLERKFATIWLFYGCRYKTRDFLFKKELNEYLNFGVLTRLIVAHSRENDEDNSKYVQDNLKKHGKDISDLIFNEKAIVYVCGDAKSMSKDVQNTFVEIFQHQQGFTNEEAINAVKFLKNEKRYLQDIWL